MNRNTGGFADSHEPRHNRLTAVGCKCQCFGVAVGRDAAHVVVHGRQNRDRLFHDIDAGKNPCRLGNTRQTFVDDFRSEVFQMQVDMILVRADAAAFTDLNRHRATDNIPRGEVLRVGRIALHEAFTLGICQVTALTARTLGDQTAGAVNAGWVKLNELHILQRQSGTQHHRVAVAGARVCRGTGEERPPVTTGGENDAPGTKTVNRAFCHVDRNDAATLTVFHDQVDRKILDIEGRIVFQGLLVQRMQHRMPGSVRGRTGALCRALAITRCHAAERTLIDLAFLGPRERYTVMLEFDDRVRRLLAHVFDRILVTEPVGTLDRVVHVPAPVVFTHVAERCADAALCRNRVTAGRENLGDAGRAQAGLGHAECRP